MPADSAAVWLRRDPRLTDQPTLLAAREAAPAGSRCSCWTSGRSARPAPPARCYERVEALARYQRVRAGH